MASKSSKKQLSNAKNLQRNASDDCVIPPPPQKHILSSYTLSNLANKRDISDYVEWQARGEKVQHAEKVKTEHVFDRSYDCWDVHTDKDRYWVVTNPTNLYSQGLFPSLDYTISFHVGVMARVAARQQGAPDDGQRLRASAVWRRWEEAAKALHSAEEAEEFQAIGMRCRECLISLVRSLSNPEMVMPVEQTPKRSDVIGWSERIANTIAPGASSDHVRSYLKNVAKSTWQLANWLTHASSVGRPDAAIVLEATQSVLAAFVGATMRFESGSPNSCPKCGSYAITVGYNPEKSPPYISACEKCDWSTIRPKRPRRQV
jgi:hypothetical protein